MGNSCNLLTYSYYTNKQSRREFYAILFRGEVEEGKNFVAQTRSEKMMMFSHSRALAKAKGDLSKYYWKDGKGRRKGGKGKLYELIIPFQ